MGKWEVCCGLGGGEGSCGKRYGGCGGRCSEVCWGVGGGKERCVGRGVGEWGKVCWRVGKGCGRGMEEV